MAVLVSDTGIGIRPEDQDIIFEKFRQVDGSATRRYRGAGLVLALSQHLMEMHGGQIWAQSRPGAGSAFGFSVPAWPAGRSSSPQAAASA